MHRTWLTACQLTASAGSTVVLLGCCAWSTQVVNGSPACRPRRLSTRTVMFMPCSSRRYASVSGSLPVVECSQCINVGSGFCERLAPLKINLQLFNTTNVRTDNGNVEGPWRSLRRSKQSTLRRLVCWREAGCCPLGLELRSVSEGLLRAAATQSQEQHQQQGQKGNAYCRLPAPPLQAVAPAGASYWPQHPVWRAGAYRQGRLPCANPKHSVWEAEEGQVTVFLQTYICCRLA